MLYSYLKKTRADPAIGGKKKYAQRTGRRSVEKMTPVGVRSEIKQKRGRNIRTVMG